MKLSEAHKRKQNLCWNRFSERTIPRLTMSRREPANGSHVFARLGCLLKWWWANHFRESHYVYPVWDLEVSHVRQGRGLERQHWSRVRFLFPSVWRFNVFGESACAIKRALRWFWRQPDAITRYTLCQRYCRQQQPYKANRSIHLWEIEHRVYLADVTVCSLWHAWKPASN